MKREWIIKRAGVTLLAGTLLCTTGCAQNSSGVEIVEKLEQEPQYLSFFAQSSFSGSDLGKYWSDRFVDTYNQQVYVNYDAASYYADEGLSYRELLEKRLESASPDDLYIINAEDVIEFADKGYWMDLSELDFVDNISDAARYQSTYDDKVFSVPLAFTGFGFYWNVTMLEEHGLSVPENLEEFMNVCQVLRAAGILPYGANKGYALTVPAMCVGLSELYGSSDLQQRIDELNSGEMAISYYMSQGFAFLSEMIEKGYLDPQQALDTEPRKEDIGLFKDGGCAFICIEMGSVSQEVGNTDFETEYTGIPVLADGSVSVYGADMRLCVNPESPNLDAALRFIEMVGTREALDESAVLRQSMSCAKDSSAGILAVQEKMAKLLQQPGQIPNQDFALHFGTWENIRNVGREICYGTGVEEACALLDEMQRTELAAYAQGDQ